MTALLPTRVLIRAHHLHATAITGEQAARGMRVRWTPLARTTADDPPRIITGRHTGATLDDDGAATATLPPGPYRVDEMSTPAYRHWVIVPDLAGGQIDYSALASVDPETLEPTEENLAGWEAVTGEVRGLRDDAYALLPQMTAVQGAAEAIAHDVQTVTGLVEEADGHASQAGQHRAAAAESATQAALAAGVRILFVGPLKGDPA